MEMPGRNELEGTSIQEYPLFGEGWEAKPLSQPATIADYLDYLYHELAEGIRRQEESGKKTHPYIIDAVDGLDVFRIAYRSCTERGWTDHEHGSIPLKKREGALSAAHIARALGISTDRAQYSIDRLKERGEIRAARTWQPTSDKYYTVFNHAAFDDPPTWAKRLFNQWEKLFAPKKRKTRTHEEPTIADEYRAFWNSTEEKHEPTEEKHEPTNTEKSVESTAFLATGENENTDVYYKSDMIQEVTNTVTNIPPIPPTGAEEAPQASIPPPPINSRQWMELNIRIIPAAINSCTDESETAELEKLADAMRHGATDFAKVDACAEILLHLHRMNRLPPWATAPRQGIGS